MTEQNYQRTVALIGAGYWGKNLARNLDSLGALHTICDKNEKLLDSYEQSYPEVVLSSNYSEVLENSEVG